MVSGWERSRAMLTGPVYLSRPCPLERHLLVFECNARTDARSRLAPRATLGAAPMSHATSLAPLLERFFTQRLMQERRVSPHTIGSYRDTFRLLLKFAQQHLHKAPCRLLFEDIDPRNPIWRDRAWKVRRMSPSSKRLPRLETNR